MMPTSPSPCSDGLRSLLAGFDGAAGKTSLRLPVLKPGPEKFESFRLSSPVLIVDCPVFTYISGFALFVYDGLAPSNAVQAFQENVGGAGNEVVFPPEAQADLKSTRLTSSPPS